MVHAGLGHRRLAVVDLVGGTQPMLAEHEGRTQATLIDAGEVYNFVELREQLERLGHQFKTRSDTEVVLRGCLEWGENVVSWADAPSGEAVMARRYRKSDAACCERSV